LTRAGQYLIEIKQRLAPVSDTPGLDAQVLLAHLLGVERAWILAHPEAELNGEQTGMIEARLSLLESGQPLPYVLGQWEFYGRTFRVTPDVLIPRPETELLVERAIQWLVKHPESRLAADVGTGSGCIAISLAGQIHDLRVLATDISLPALRIAQDNARRHRVQNRMMFAQADLLAAARQPLDLICANLPYIPGNTLHRLPVFGKEPVTALDGGPDGLRHIGRLTRMAPYYLAAGGMMLLEIEAHQGANALALSRRSFPQARIELHTDLAGHDRLVEIENRASI